MASSEVKLRSNPQIEKLLSSILSEERAIKVGLVGKPEIGAATGSDAKMSKDEEGEYNFNDDVDLAYIASIHEWGYEGENITIPQRSFLRSTFEEEKERVGKNLAIAIRKQAKENKYDPELALHKVGVWMVGKVKKKFTNNDWPALKDPTRGGKNFEGTATPLVDTGQLRASIDYELVKVK